MIRFVPSQSRVVSTVKPYERRTHSPRRKGKLEGKLSWKFSSSGFLPFGSKQEKKAEEASSEEFFIRNFVLEQPRSIPSFLVRHDIVLLFPLLLCACRILTRKEKF
jgi:hypothetical protein